MDAEIDVAHRQLQPLAVAHVADEIAQRRRPLRRHALLHLVLLELVAGEDDDPARLGVAHHRLDEAAPEGAGSPRHQNRPAVQHAQARLKPGARQVGPIGRKFRLRRARLAGVCGHRRFRPCKAASLEAAGRPPKAPDGREREPHRDRNEPRPSSSDRDGRHPAGLHILQQADLRRQADGGEVEALHRRPPRGGRQGGAQLRVVQRRLHPVGERQRVVEVRQQPVHPILDHLGDRRRVGPDDDGAAGHRLQHRPGQDEGEGQVDVGARDAQDRQVLLIGQLAQHMQPRRLMPGSAGGVQHRLPPHRLAPGAAALRRRAIADLVAAHHQDVQLRPAPQQLRRRPHEGGKAAVGLQVAGDIGHHLVLARQGAAVGQGDGGGRIRPADRGVDPVMDHRDARAEGLGMLLALPQGRADAPVHRVQPGQQRGVLGADAAARLQRHRPLRVEADVRPVGPVEEFAIEQQPGVREQILQEQGLAPAGMGADHVGGEALLLQGQPGAHGALPVQDLPLEHTDVGVGVFPRLARRPVERHLHAARQLAPDLADEGDPVGRIRREMADEMLVLAGGVLVDEQDPHGKTMPGKRRNGATACNHPSPLSMHKTIGFIGAPGGAAHPPRPPALSGPSRDGAPTSLALVPNLFFPNLFFPPALLALALPVDVRARAFPRPRHPAEPRRRRRDRADGDGAGGDARSGRCAHRDIGGGDIGEPALRLSRLDGGGDALVPAAGRAVDRVGPVQPPARAGGPAHLAGLAPCHPGPAVRPPDRPLAALLPGQFRRQPGPEGQAGWAERHPDPGDPDQRHHPHRHHPGHRPDAAGLGPAPVRRAAGRLDRGAPDPVGPAGPALPAAVARLLRGGVVDHRPHGRHHRQCRAGARLRPPPPGAGRPVRRADRRDRPVEGAALVPDQDVVLAVQRPAGLPDRPDRPRRVGDDGRPHEHRRVRHDLLAGQHRRHQCVGPVDAHAGLLRTAGRPVRRPGSDHIRFAHPGSDPETGGAVFDGLSLTIRPGERVALVGPSGAGKSTLVRLLRRQFPLQGGRILIDEQDIAAVSLASLNRAVAEVPQLPSLFHRSIRDNIAYGSEGPDGKGVADEAIRAASARAHCDRFIEGRAAGYDTVVGERGIQLSGGERQRVAIARAFLKNAPVLVLDEATSSLDSETEHLIQDALLGLFEGRTVIAIAHRLSTVTGMDRILYMEKGRILEDGDHATLLRRDGPYARLWRRQVGGFLPDDAGSVTDMEEAR
ncbi:hypothetical protein Lal_00015230 [Lupinus albus]|nr:hypothetical protein Lal_00015230 [Lupinus albus]